MTQLTSVQFQYQKALRLFLLTKYTTAATTCVKAIARLPKANAESNSALASEDIHELEALRFSIWTLYLNIATTLLTQDKLTPHVTKLFALSPSAAKSHDQFLHEMWQLLADGYGGSGNVDPRLVSSCLVMTLKLDTVNVGRQIVEQWYANMQDATMDYISAVTAQGETSSSTDVYYNGFMEAIDLYVTRVLPAMNDYETAMTFVQYNPLISDEKKEALQAYIHESEQKIVRAREKEIEEQKNLERLAKLAEDKERERLQKERERTEKELAETHERHERQANGHVDSESSYQHTRAPSESSSSSSFTDNGQPPTDRQLSKTSTTSNRALAQSSTAWKEWASQLFGTSTPLAAFFAILALIGLLRGFRGRWSDPVRLALNKLWQTVRMGTKVTYM